MTYIVSSGALNSTHSLTHTVIYSSAANNIQSNYILNVACVFHSCSRLQHFYNLQKFNLETCSEKPEVDIIMPSIVSKGHFVQ